LILEKKKDYKYWIRLNTIIEHYGLLIDTSKVGPESTRKYKRLYLYPRRAYVSIMDYKICSKCGESKPATEEFFYYRDKGAGTFRHVCKNCSKKRDTDYYKDNAGNLKKHWEEYYKRNPEQICIICKTSKPATKEHYPVRSDSGKLRNECLDCTQKYKNEYYGKNRDSIISKSNRWIKNNRDRFNATSKKSYQKHREKRLEQGRIRAKTVDRSVYFEKYNSENTEKFKEKRRSPVLFRTYASQLTIDDCPQESENGYLLCQCTYCGKFFKPTLNAVGSRIRSLKGQSGGVSRLYCLESCKKACPVFNQNIWPKGFKKGTSREVMPELRQMALERDNYECQKCGKHISEIEIHVHHIEGASQNQMISNDLENVISLCKPCHKWVHTQEGCRYFELRCK
jgi:5-methylcytosine-specific restriction enzyme A